MAFLDVIRRSSGQGSLLREIEQRYQRKQTKPPLDKATYSVRSSAIPSLCAREEVICALHNITRNDDVDAALNLIFLHGTALHWGVQNRLLPEIGVIYGLWRCLHCGQMHGKPDGSVTVDQWAIPRPALCGIKGCKSNDFEYVEHSFADESIRLTGHCDGFLRIPGLPGMGVLELKSVGGKNAIDAKSAPQIAHVIQAHAYMMFTGFQWGKILYWVKGGTGLGSLIEHHIERDEETIQLIRETLLTLGRGLHSGVLPDRICATSTCPRASKCAVVSLCFSDAHAI